MVQHSKEHGMIKKLTIAAAAFAFAVGVGGSLTSQPAAAQGMTFHVDRDHHHRDRDWDRHHRRDWDRRHHRRHCFSDWRRVWVGHHLERRRVVVCR
jgi:hypothetical protein